MLTETINSELANVLGNLVNRTISMAKKYFDGIVTNTKISEDVDIELIRMVNELDKNVTEKMDSLHIGEAIEAIFEVLKRSNKYIDETTPWVLAKSENKDRLETVLFNLLESIRVCAVFLQPYIPETSDKIMEQLNIEDKSFSFNENNQYNVNDPHPLFLRIEKK